MKIEIAHATTAEIVATLAALAGERVTVTMLRQPEQVISGDDITYWQSAEMASGIVAAIDATGQTVRVQLDAEDGQSFRGVVLHGSDHPVSSGTAFAIEQH